MVFAFVDCEMGGFVVQPGDLGGLGGEALLVVFWADLDAGLELCGDCVVRALASSLTLEEGAESLSVAAAQVSPLSVETETR